MSEILFAVEDYGEPPSLTGVRATKRQFERIINQLPDSLSYAHIESKSGDSAIMVDGYNLEIAGHLGGRDLLSMEVMSRHDGLLRLRRKISRSMAKMAIRFGGTSNDDSEFDYPVFTNSVDGGAVFLMFRDEARKGMITSQRDTKNDRLWIESRDIQDDYEQKVLLGGLAALIVALEKNT